ncbi:hypothetical protein DV454_000803 [Geotrichum candidum]|nr:hypothetical protein DV454_000803 [Geotrichum candidum]
MSFNQLPLSDFNNGSINWFDDISSKPLSPIKPSNASISSRLSVQSIQKSPPAIQPPPPKKQRIPSSFLSSYKIHELMMESSSHNQNLSSDLIEALARWMVCIMVVQFDVEIGPDLKIIQPAIQFTEEDFQAICFSSLPERSSSKESKSQFHSFRFQSSTFPDTVLHGYALFSQQRSRSSSRGYIQESLVIVSRLDYPQLFNACLQLMADIVDHNREFNSSVEEENDMIYSQIRRKIHDRDGFIEDDDSSIRKRKLAHSTSVNSLLDEKLPIIHTAISNISQWPDPDPNSTLELGFLGTIINLSIPLYDSSPLLGTIDLDTKSANFHSHNVKGLSKHSVSTSDLTNFSCDPKLYTQHNAPVITATEPSANWDYLVNFVSDISDLYILYEYMLLAKPIVVYSSSPHLCSSFISLLVDLIRPIPYAGRIREYVTIHTCPSDMDSGIIGVTNPFLVKGIAKSDTLLFVLSPPENLSNSAKKALMSAPFQYYRTFHNGVGVLRRQSILRQSQSVNAMSTTPLSSMEKTDVAMNSPLAVTSPLGNRQSHANASWTSRLFSRYISNFGFNNGKMHRRHIDKTGISMPITSTFAKLPTSFSAFGANITKTHKRNQSNSTIIVDNNATSARNSSANTVSLLRNLSRKSLVTGSTTSLPGAATAPATSAGLLMRASVDLDRGNSRSSMLSLSSLGLSFNGTGAGLSDGNGTMSEKAGFISNNSDSMNTDEEIFHYTSPPALPLQPPAPRRTSSRKFSGKHVNPLPPTTKPVNEEDEETETNGDDDITDNFEENDIAPAISLLPGLHESRVKRFQKQTADLHKQSIYKTFIGSDNFKEWLHMNNVNNNRKS